MPTEGKNSAKLEAESALRDAACCASSVPDWSGEIKTMVDTICDVNPDLRRRRGGLLPLLRSFGVMWIIAKTQRQPMRGLVSSLGLAVRSRKLRVKSVDHVSHPACRVHENPLLAKQLVQCLVGGLGHSVPSDEILVVRQGHRNVPIESLNKSRELCETHMLAAGHKIVDGGLHSDSSIILHNA